MASSTRFTHSIMLWIIPLALPLAIYLHPSGNFVIQGILWFISGVYGFRLNDLMILIGAGIPMGLPIIVTAVVLQLYLLERIQRRTTRWVLYLSVLIEVLVLYIHPAFFSYLVIPIPFASLVQVLAFRRIDDEVDLY